MFSKLFAEFSKVVC